MSESGVVKQEAFSWGQHISSSEFLHYKCTEPLFQGTYMRSNKMRGAKILRCFPHCCPEHLSRCYCGTSLHIKLHVKDEPKQQDLKKQSLVVYARFEPMVQTSLLSVGDTLPHSVILEDLANTEPSNPSAYNTNGSTPHVNANGKPLPSSSQQPQRQEDTPEEGEGSWIPAKLEDDAKQQSGSLLYAFNNTRFPKWYYAYESGSTKAQREMKHQIKAYVFEILEGTPYPMLRVVSTVESTPFTIVSYRRARKEKSKTNPATIGPSGLGGGGPLMSGYAGGVESFRRDSPVSERMGDSHEEDDDGVSFRHPHYPPSSTGRGRSTMEGTAHMGRLAYLHRAVASASSFRSYSSHLPQRMDALSHTTNQSNVPPTHAQELKQELHYRLMHRQEEREWKEIQSTGGARGGRYGSSSHELKRPRATPEEYEPVQEEAEVMRYYRHHRDDYDRDPGPTPPPPRMYSYYQEEEEFQKRRRRQAQEEEEEKVELFLKAERKRHEQMTQVRHVAVIGFFLSHLHLSHVNSNHFEWTEMILHRCMDNLWKGKESYSSTDEIHTSYPSSIDKEEEEKVEKLSSPLPLSFDLFFNNNNNKKKKEQEQKKNSSTGTKTFDDLMKTSVELLTACFFLPKIRSLIQQFFQNCVEYPHRCSNRRRRRPPPPAPALRLFSKIDQEEMFLHLLQALYEEMTSFLYTKNMSIDQLIDEILSLIYQNEDFASIRCPLRHLLAWTSLAPYKNKVYQAFIAQLREVQLHSISRMVGSSRNYWYQYGGSDPRQVVDTSCGLNGAWLLDPKYLKFVYKQEEESIDFSLLTLIRRLNETLCLKLVMYKRGGDEKEEASTLPPQQQQQQQQQQQHVLGIQSESSFLHKREFMRLNCDGKRRIFRWFPNGLASMISLPSDLLYGEYTAKLTKTNGVEVVLYGVPLRRASSSSSSSMRVCLTIEYLSEAQQLQVDGVLEKESSSGCSSPDEWQEMVVLQAKYNRIKTDNLKYR